MAIHEYAVPNDFFQFEVDDPSIYNFPCCVCRHNKTPTNETPCKFCGHNETAEDFFYCCLCEEIQPGKPGSENIIAIRTPAEIGPMCLTCKNTIKATME